MADISKKVGIAVEYPLRLENGRVATITGAPLMKQSMVAILGQDAPAFFRGEFKSKLDQLTFEQSDEVLLSLLDTFIREALYTFEKRIEVVNIDFDTTVPDGAVLCKVNFRIIGETNVESFVYPFYRELEH